MHEVDKIEVKLEPSLKIEKDLCGESNLEVYNLHQESYKEYKTENSKICAGRTHINKYLKLEDGFDVTVEAIKIEQCETAAAQEEFEYESKLWSNSFSIHNNVQTVPVEEIQIKDETTINESHSCLKSVDSNSLHMCNICQYKTEVKSRFAKHIKTHMGEKSFVCNVCYFRTTTNDYLQDHKKIHECNRTYSKCSYCDYKSTKKSNIKRHMEICKVKECSASLKKKNSNSSINHNNDIKKHFKCDRCNYSSNFKCSLGNHKKIHLDRILKCNKCDYTTLKQHELSLHVMVHDGRQPYECGICGYKAAFKKNLQRHVLKHAETKPFKCNWCSYNTYRKHHLTSHMLMHMRKKNISTNQSQDLV